MKNKLHFCLFLILICAASQKFLRFSIPDKDSFVKVESNTFTLMELKEGQRELYFKYENKFEKSDIVINIKKAKQYTTHLYLYNSYESIKKNAEGEYIDFVEDLDLSDKLLFVKGSEKTTYYFIIKDLGDYSTKDQFLIYNEKDVLELKEEEPFTFNSFLSQNLYTFSFKGESFISLEDFSKTGSAVPPHSML